MYGDFSGEKLEYKKKLLSVWLIDVNQLKNTEMFVIIYNNKLLPPQKIVVISIILSDCLVKHKNDSLLPAISYHKW